MKKNIASVHRNNQQTGWTQVMKRKTSWYFTYVKTKFSVYCVESLTSCEADLGCLEVA